MSYRERFSQAPESSAGSGPANAGEQLVRRLINDSEHPVVVFSRGFCGYCTAVKSLLKEAGVKFQAVEVDAPEFREGGLYREIRDSLLRLSGQSTVPQVFIHGESIGGYRETYSLYSRGELEAKLAAFGSGSD